MSTFPREDTLSVRVRLYPRGIFHSTGDGKQLAKSATVCILDEPIKPYLLRLELFRTPYTGHRPHFPGRVFRSKGFTHVLKEARA
jgi:hypothetical protein